MGEEKGWILNSAIIWVRSTSQMQWLNFQQLCCLLLHIFATEVCFFLCVCVFQSLVLRPGQLTELPGENKLSAEPQNI